jgi:hypothetical protein
MGQLRRSKSAGEPTQRYRTHPWPWQSSPGVYGDFDAALDTGGMLP